MNISDFEQKLTKATNELNKFAKGGVGSIGNLGNAIGTLTGRGSSSIMGLVGSVGSLAASFGLTASVVSVVGDSIEKAMDFEKSMSSLKALTGLGENEMGKLKDAAIALGSTTTQSASQVADAFRLIGSSKPELLSSTDALKSVTRDAITLAEAAGMEVPQAAAALTTSLNQMGAGAEESSRYINVLAAGSQKGAGDINWLNSAITQAGTAAKAVGTDFEELVANLEQLAQGGFDASSAGTALRSIIMSLEKQSNNNLKPSVVGLTTAFRNLGQECKTIGQYQAVVGKEFASQAKILANNAEKANEMKDAITGTATATEQAKINNDNFAGSIKNLSSAWEGLLLTINSSNGILRRVVDNTTTLVNNLKFLLSSYNNKVSMGADMLLEGTNGNGLLGHLSGRMDATVSEGWSKEKATGWALEELKEWYRQQKEIHKDSAMELEMVDLAYMKARNYVRSYYDEIEAGQQRVDAGGGAGGNTTTPTKTPKGTVFGEGSIGYYQQMLKKANEAVLTATDAEARAAAQRTVEIYQRELDRLKGGSSTPGTGRVNTDIADITGLKNAAGNMDISGAKEQYNSDVTHAEDWKKYKELLKEVDTFHRETMVDGISRLGSAFQTLGDAIGGTEGSILSLIGTMADQVLQGVLTIANIQAQAAAYGTKAAALATDSTMEMTDAAAKTANAAASTMSGTAAAGEAAGLTASATAAKVDATAHMTDAAAKTMNANALVPLVGVAIGLSLVGTLVSALSSLPKLAEGAFVDRPTMGIFGEAGPELVLPERKLDEAFERNADKMGGGMAQTRLEVETIVMGIDRWAKRTGKGKLQFG